MTAAPARPTEFTPEGLPPNTVSMLVPFWQQRAVQKPRISLVHTNGANGIATNQSSYNWATSKPNSNTLPHYQIQLDGRAAKYIPTDRRGLDNATVAPGTTAFASLSASVQQDILAHGQVRNWSIGIETSDLGYCPTCPGDQSGFTDAQIETLAGIWAYDAIVWQFPLAYPTSWWGTGTACHTEPFTYPYWTLYKGKSCPGSKKKALVQSRVIPRAIEIFQAWSDTPAPPPDPGTPPVITFPTGDDDVSFRGIYRGPDNSANPALFQLYSDGTKLFITDPGMWEGTKTMCALGNIPSDVQVVSDLNLWAALGVIKTGTQIPAGYDQYAVRL